MRCYICDKTDDFLKFEHADLKRPICVCNNCGNTQLLVNEGDEDKATEYYDKEYRGQIGVANLQTTSRKMMYIISFLDEYIKAIPENKQLRVADIGCATGYILNWFKQKGHKVCGSELTTVMRRFSEHFYNIPIYKNMPEPETEEKKFDLIIIYHVLEHLYDPDIKLKKYVSWLKPDGKILIATPEWFNALEQGGMPYQLDFHEYFHDNHINCFSQNSIKNIFGKCGLEIVKENHQTYGQTYLTQKRPNDKQFEINKDNAKDIYNLIPVFEKTIKLLKEGKYRDAINTYKNCPLIYIQWVENTSLRKDPDRAEDVWKEGMENCKGNVHLLARYGFWLYQHQKWDELLTVATECITIKPSEDAFNLRALANFNLGNWREAMNDYQMVININPATWSQNITFICKSATEMPCWEEVAEKELKEKLFNQTKPIFKLNEEK